MRKDRRLPMIGYYNASVILTYVGLVLAVVGIIQALDGRPQAAILCLMGAGLCDMFDGTIARMCDRSEEEKAFGVQIDSLCDLVCFGILPMIIGYAVGNTSWVGTACQAAYMLAVVIRLGYFNVQEIWRAQEDGEKRTHYEGLPVTAVSLLLPAGLLLDIPTRFSILRFYNFALLTLAIFFVAKIRVKKPYGKTLLILSAIGIVLFVLVCRYGGAIECLRSTVAR